jgi:hypothetical protein
MTKVSEFSAPIPEMPCQMAPSITPDCFAAEMIRVYIDRECKDKLRKVQQTYADCHNG